MAGTQGSSYSSSGAAAAANKTITSNIKAGNNASGSVKVSTATKPSSSVNAAAAAAAAKAATAAKQSSSKPMGAALGSFGGGSGLNGNTSNQSAKTSLPTKQAANQVAQKGINQSAADYMAQGYGAYKNPNATQGIQNGFGKQIASLAAPKQNIQTVNKGINQSAADMLAAGYGKYQSPPSMQSTPVAAQNGWSALGGLHQAVSRMNPNLGQIVAGDPISSFKPVSSAGEIGSLVKPMFGGADYGAQMANAALTNIAPSVPKDLSRIAQAPDIPVTESYWANKQQLPGNVYASLQGGPQAPSINDVPSLPNYAPPVSVAAREPSPYSSPTAPVQTASLTSPTAGQGATFRNPASAKQYNAAMGGLLSAGNQVAGNAQPANSNDAIVAYNDLYDGPSTPQQKVNGYLEKKFETIADPVRKVGDKINGLLGGSGYNDSYSGSGASTMNTRDPLNSEAEKGASQGPRTETSIAAQSPEFNAMSQNDQNAVLTLIQQGYSFAAAIAKVKGQGNTATAQAARPPVRYPEYYSKWANLPSGAYA